MYAVIKTGGKQYRVAADDVITIEKIAGVFGLEAYQLFSDTLPPTELKPQMKAPAPHKRARTK